MRLALAALAVLVVMALAAPAYGAACSVAGAGSTNLEKAADSLSAGEWCTLESSSGLVEATFVVNSTNVATQTYAAVWDTVNNELRWVGQKQGNSGTSQSLSRHIKYDEATDTWSNGLASPVGQYEPGHGNDQSAIEPGGIKR